MWEVTFSIVDGMQCVTEDSKKLTACLDRENKHHSDFAG